MHVLEDMHVNGDESVAVYLQDSCNPAYVEELPYVLCFVIASDGHDGELYHLQAGRASRRIYNSE